LLLQVEFLQQPMMIEIRILKKFPNKIDKKNLNKQSMQKQIYSSNMTISNINQCNTGISGLHETKQKKRLVLIDLRNIEEKEGREKTNLSKL
jgi:hypothetical protein